jgi:hypothetical protein
MQYIDEKWTYWGEPNSEDSTCHKMSQSRSSCKVQYTRSRQWLDLAGRRIRKSHVAVKVGAASFDWGWGQMLPKQQIGLFHNRPWERRGTWPMSKYVQIKWSSWDSSTWTSVGTYTCLFHQSHVSWVLRIRPERMQCHWHWDCWKHIQHHILEIKVLKVTKGEGITSLL